MSKNNPYDDAKAHERLMREIAKAVNTVEETGEQFMGLEDALIEHNESDTAHQDIRELIANLDSVNTEALDEAFETHNKDKESHEDIRELINQLDKKMESDTTAAEIAIDDHNEATDAHQDIRTQINNLNLAIGENNISDISQQLSTIRTSLRDTYDEEIYALQTKDAHHDDLINTNINSIKALNRHLKSTDIDVTYIATQNAQNIESIDRVSIVAYCLEQEDLRGYKVYDEQGPSLLELHTNLGIYATNGTTVAFLLEGLTEYLAARSTANLTIKLEVLEGDFTLSTLTPELNETIYMNVGEGNAPGDFLGFSATITDEDTGVSLTRVFAVISARPLNTTAIRLDGWPTGLEPGSEYEFVVSNIADVNDGTYTYALDPMSTGLIFEPSTDIRENDLLKVTVPANTPRDATLTFKIKVYNKNGSTADVEYSTVVNHLITINDLEHNVPKVVAPGATYKVKFYGITSAQKNPCTFDLEPEENGNIVFSKSKGILTNEIVTMYVGSNVIRDATYKFKITTHDENGVSLTTDIPVKINLLPDAFGIKCTLDGITTKGGRTIMFTLTGGTDVDQEHGNQPMRSGYAITSVSHGAVSKINNIKDGESISITVPKVANDTTARIEVHAMDETGEMSTNLKVITFTIEPIYVTDAPTLITPVANYATKYGVPYNSDDKSWTFEWSDMTYHIDI